VIEKRKTQEVWTENRGETRERFRRETRKVESREE